MDALIVIDMQEGLRQGPPKHDLDGVIRRINALAARVRDRGGRVIFIKHESGPTEPFQPGTTGWELIGGLDFRPGDVSVGKTRNDAFFQTNLEALLRELGATRLIIAGWATDFCVDGTVRTAAALGFPVVAVADAHTVSDRPHLPATAVKTHHHHIWRGLVAARPVQIANAADV